MYYTTKAESKENEKGEDEEDTTTFAEETAAHENGWNENMNVLEAWMWKYLFDRIKKTDDIDHTLYSSEDEDDDLACVWRW